jgi:hypothetical protein
VLKVPSQIVKVETMSDGGMKVVLNTNEMTAAEKAELMEQHNKFGWMVFAPTADISEQDIPDEPIEFEGHKTYSEQLRNVLFRLHEAQGGKPEEFESYRSKVMTKLINGYKAKIDDFKN